MGARSKVRPFFSIYTYKVFVCYFGGSNTCRYAFANFFYSQSGLLSSHLAHLLVLEDVYLYHGTCSTRF